MLANKSWLGANPRALIPSLKYLLRVSGISLPRRPTDDDLQMMMDVWGSAKEFELNAPAAAAALRLENGAASIPGKRLLKGIEDTGLLNRFGPRSVHGYGRPRVPVVVFLTSAIANWTEKRVNEFLFQVSSGNINVAMVVLLAGERPCGQPTELTNPYVRDFMDRNRGRVPTESELLPFIWRDKTGHRVTIHHASLNRDDQVRAHLQARPSLARLPIYLPGNAPVALSEALKIRRVIREFNPDFDEHEPQLWVSQGSVVLAKTARQAANARRYQRPLTFFSALARAVKELYLLNR